MQACAWWGSLAVSTTASEHQEKAMWLARVLCPKRSDLLKPAVKNGGKDKSKSKGEGKSTRNSVVPCIVQAGKEVLHTYHLPKGALSNVLMDLMADLLGVPVNIY